MTDQEIRDEELVNAAAQRLFDTYMASNHRGKLELIQKAFNFARQAHRGVRRLSGEPYILHPTELYERVGDVPNVTFPCSTLQDKATGRIAIYYGAADSYTGLAFGYLDEIIDFIKERSMTTPNDIELGKY